MKTKLRAYFGGTFDPPHIAHDEMLRALLADPWIASVHIVPTSLNPLKAPASDGSENLGSAPQRRAWVEAWLGSLRESLDAQALAKIHLETDELEAAGPSYTVETLDRLKQRHGGAWVLCVGGDVPRDFARWKNVQQVFESLHSVWIFARGSQERPLDDVDVSLRPLTSFRVMAQRISEISSSELRRHWRRGQCDDLPILPSVLAAMRA